jgi:hypothetical protein
MNTAPHPVRETDVDGVLCFYADTGRAPWRARLLFRQGLADEPLPEAGWLHLLAHLALLDRETLSRPIEGSTGMLLTTFHADGNEEALVANLGALASWLTDPDLRLLARERGVLQADAQLRGDPLLRSLTWRYGASGPGVSSYADAGAIRATPELLAERCQRVFNRSNAVLVLDGPPPAGLRLPLPSGAYLAPTAAAALPRAHPASYVDDAGLTLSGVVPRSLEASFLPGLLERAIHDGMREHTGGVYGPWSSQVDIDDQHVVVGAGSEVVPEILPIVAQVGYEISRGLAQDGVPRPWLQEAIEARLRALEAPDAAFRLALDSAHAVLGDRVPPSRDELVEAVRGTAPESIDSVARAFHSSLLVGLPEPADVHPSAPRVAFPEADPAGVVPRFRHVDWPAELTTFGADEHTVEAVHGHEVHRMQVADVVGVFAWRDGTRLLIGCDGSTLEMEPRQWLRGQELTATLDRMIPESLRVPMPDRQVTFRRLALPQKCAVAFARSANTVRGLSVMVGVTLLLALLLVLGGAGVLAVVFLLLTAVLAGQLWRIRGQHPPMSVDSPGQVV